MKTFITKFLVLALVAVVLSLAGSMVRSVMSERIHYRDTAQRSVVESLAEAQGIAGVALIVPYTEIYSDTEITPQTGEKRTIERRELHQREILPDTMTFNGDLMNDARHLGIFRVNGYVLHATIKGALSVPSLESLPRSRSNSRIELGQARLAVAITDPRGLRAFSAQLAQKPLNAEAGTGMSGLSRGASGIIPDINALFGRNLDYAVELELVGSDSLRIVPVARENKASLTSPWPHPRFAGRFLPIDSRLTDGGFEAAWKVTSLASNARQSWPEASRSGNLNVMDTFSVSLIEPVDIYALSDRAGKYAELFIALTLGSFVLLELLRNLRLHPLQYLLVGVAQILFFLLLLAFAEHLGFATAYLIAATACVTLIGFYSRYLLRSIWLALGFTTGLGLLYGALYAILQSEQNALLMGSCLLFVVLAAVMVATRHVNWHQVFGDHSKASPAPQKATPEPGQ